MYLKDIMPSNWIELKKYILDPDFHKICEYGYRLEVITNKIESQFEWKRDIYIKYFQRFALLIIKEYMRLIRMGIIDETQLDQIRDDLRTFLSYYIKVDPRSGSMSIIELSRHIMNAKQEKREHLFILNFMEPIITYIHHVVYGSLVNVIKRQSKQFKSLFSEEATFRSLGLTPKMKDEDKRREKL